MVRVRTNNQKISRDLMMVRICLKAMGGDRVARLYMRRLHGKKLSYKELEALLGQYRKKVSPLELEREFTQWMILTHWGPTYTKLDHN